MVKNIMANRDTEYMYASTYVRALEGASGISERLSRMADAKSAAEAFAQLAEAGVSPVTDADGDVQFEATLESLVSDALVTVSESAPDPDTFAFLRYPYDCVNLKTALKCEIRAVSSDGLFYDCGTVPASDVRALAASCDFSRFPPEMARAAQDAVDAYAKTRDPQLIDTKIDRGCYLDMVAAAEKTGSAMLVGFVQTRIDMINIITFVRLCRMNAKTASSLLGEALLAGGALAPDFFRSHFDGGEDELKNALFGTAYHQLAERMSAEELPLWKLEKLCDEQYLARLDDVRFLPFGMEVLFAYVVRREYEAKNVRILLAGKAAGMSGEQIRERMRGAYV